MSEEMLEHVEQDALVGAIIKVGSDIAQRMASLLKWLIVVSFGAGVFFGVITFKVDNVEDVLTRNVVGTEARLRSLERATDRDILPEAEERLDKAEDERTQIRERLSAIEAVLRRLER